MLTNWKIPAKEHVLFIKLLFSSFSLLLLSCSIAVAQDKNTPTSPVQGNVKKPEATIWLEEKITPSSMWLEDIVKPMTSWMEDYIHEPESTASSNSTSAHKPETDVEPQANTTYISAKQAASVAQSAVEGDVLMSKLLATQGRYRVKLLSVAGEIHVLYVDALSAELLTTSKRKD